MRKNAGVKVNQMAVASNTGMMGQISAFALKIAELFDPQKIILFGSHAYGKPHENSDVDILVIMTFKGKGFRKSLEILKTIDPHFSVDLLARLPKDTDRRYQEGDPLIRMALDHGKVLYERHS